MAIDCSGSILSGDLVFALSLTVFLIFSRETEEIDVNEMREKKRKTYIGMARLFGCRCRIVFRYTRGVRRGYGDGGPRTRVQIGHTGVSHTNGTLGGKISHTTRTCTRTGSHRTTLLTLDTISSNAYGYSTCHRQHHNG